MRFPGRHNGCFHQNHRANGPVAIAPDHPELPGQIAIYGSVPIRSHKLARDMGRVNK